MYYGASEEFIMVFGYWAILTGIICVIGFSYLVYASFSDEPVEKPENITSKE